MRWWDGTRWTEHTADWAGIHPTPAAVRPPDIGDSVASERPVATWLQRALVLWPLAVALSVGGLVTSIDQLADSSDSSSLPSLWWLGQLGGLVGIAVLVLRILWLYRAASVARALGLPARRDPTRAAVGWLIPVVNYWWPYQGVTDVFPPGRRPDRRIAWWWATSIVSQFSLLAAVAAPFVPTGVGVVLVVAALGPAVVAAALEVGLVRDAVAVHAALVVA